MILKRSKVTLYTGVWIETGQGDKPNRSNTSLPIRECGLKHPVRRYLGTDMRHSLYGSVD